MVWSDLALLGGGAVLGLGGAAVQRHWARRDARDLRALDDHARTFDERKTALLRYLEALEQAHEALWGAVQGREFDPGEPVTLPPGYLKRARKALPAVAVWASPETAKVAHAALDVTWRWGIAMRASNDAFLDGSHEAGVARDAFVAGMRRDLGITEPTT